VYREQDGTENQLRFFRRNLDKLTMVCSIGSMKVRCPLNDTQVKYGENRFPAANTKTQQHWYDLLSALVAFCDLRQHAPSPEEAANFWTEPSIRTLKARMELLVNEVPDLMYQCGTDGDITFIDNRSGDPISSDKIYEYHRSDYAEIQGYIAIQYGQTYQYGGKAE
jgi:hypothetical protein